jgi:multimeric flavodoxin WrbA
MRVVGIAGSPRARNGVTQRLVEAAVLGAASTEVIHVASLGLRRCKGCGECFRTGRCPQDDDLCYVLGRMMSADGIVLGSPAYAGGVTSPVEMLFERMGDVVHCRRLEGRYGFCIAVSRDGDERFVASQMSHFLSNCGVSVTGSLAIAADDERTIENAILAAGAMGKDLADAIAQKRRSPEYEGDRAEFLKSFRESVVANKDRWAHDYRYWHEKGWV